MDHVTPVKALLVAGFGGRRGCRHTLRYDRASDVEPYRYVPGVVHLYRPPFAAAGRGFDLARRTGRALDA